jgi:DNA-binding transcriptional LysR family regulator
MHQNLVEQLNVFMTVVESASLSGAARQLGRAVSTISYARALDRGEEPTLRFAVDLVFPHTMLMTALSRFAQAHSHVRLKMLTTSLNQSWKEILSGQVDFCLAPLRRLPPGLEGKSIVAEKLIIVAAPSHPLAAFPGPIPLDELKRHRQFYYADADVDIERHGRIFSTDFWTASDLWMIRLMVRAGLGWCFATDDWARTDLEEGHMVRLELTDMLSDGVWTFGAVWPIDRAPGPLGSRFIATLEEMVSQTA